MQEFFINKNSTLPTLRMSLIKDGRHSFLKFYNAIQDADIYFTMINADNGNIKISEEPCYIQLRENDGCVEEYCICYDWKERDTNEEGSFIGMIDIRFNGNLTSAEGTYPSGNLITPIREKLLINIV